MRSAMNRIVDIIANIVIYRIEYTRALSSVCLD